jgi:hypothetical protein
LGDRLDAGGSETSVSRWLYWLLVLLIVIFVVSALYTGVLDFALAWLIDLFA